jgi:hypothetical protein
MTEPELHAVESEEQEEATEVQPVPHDALVDMQVSTAKRYPRSVTAFTRKVRELACQDEETAGECLYALRRSGKVIEGPSVRFAEILLYGWMNARADARVVEEGATHLTAEGTFYDLERNVAVRKLVKRRITDKNGRRYNEDMIGVTGNAAISIAYRNAVFAGIPRALWKNVYQEARKASIGKARTLTKKREEMLTHFEKMGAENAKVFAFLGVKGLEDVNEDQLILMRGVANTIRDGEAHVEDVFNPRNMETNETPDLNARIRDKGKDRPEPAA